MPGRRQPFTEFRLQIPSNTLDTVSPQRDTEFSMLDTNQGVPYVNMRNVLRSAVLHHDWDGFAASDLPRLLPTLADFTNNGNLNQFQSTSTFVENLPNEEAPNLVQWSPTFAEYSVNGGHLNLIQFSTASACDGSFALTQPSTACAITEPCFDFGCNVLASAVNAIANFISDSKSWERFYRTSISSSAVSKDGHLSFLVPSYREVCIKTAARDHVVHLEVITLAEDQEAPGTSAVGQILISGGKLWKRWRNRLSSLYSKRLRKTLPGGFTAGGLGFASVEPLLQY